jgi:two-component sensor histidine kinase
MQDFQSTGEMRKPFPRPDVARLQRQQAALLEFGSYALREPLLCNILTEAARVCAESLGAPFCKVCRYRAIEGDLLVEAGFGWQAGVVGLVVSKADETSVQGRAFVTGQPVIIPNRWEANTVMLPAFYGQHGITSTMDVIIKALDGVPYGVLEIASAAEHVYDQHDVDFLTGFASLLAEAVATVQRSEVLRQTTQQMQTQVLDKDRLLAEKAVLAEELKHRVRNSLQVIQGMLTSHLKIKSGSEENASIHGIIRRVITLSEVYEQLLGTGMSRTLDLGAYLKALCDSLPGLQNQQNSQIELTCVADAVCTDLNTVTAMGMVVAELISNSYEHAFAKAGGSIAVSLRQPEAGSGAVLTVRDTGSGFTERPGSKRHGVGLVRRLMQQVQGTADMQTEGGAVWVLRFPVVPAAQEILYLLNLGR